MNGKYAIVGANGSTDNSAYIYFKNSKGVFELQSTLKSSDSKPGDQFGSSVSIGNNVAVVGAMWTDINKDGEIQKDAGAAYVFEKRGDEWIESAKLQAGDPNESDQFGISVSLSNGQIAIGSIWNDYDEDGKKRRADAGAVYIFEKVNEKWVQKQKLVSNERKPYDLFGVSVSLDNNNLLVGAYRNGFDEKGKNYIEFAGSAYYFAKNSEGIWEQKQKLIAGNRTKLSFFGYSVSLHNNQAIIGSQEHNLDTDNSNPLQGSGAAYFFELENGVWKEKQKVTAMDRQKDSFFGESVSIYNDNAIIGSWGQSLDLKGIHSNSLDTSGAAYLFTKNETGFWKQSAKLLPNDRHVGDQFGISVSIDQESALIGAWGYDVVRKDDTVLWSGAAYLYSNCKKPNLNISASNEIIVEGEDVILSLKGADTVYWKNNIENNVSFKPLKTMTYIAFGRNTDGCYSQDSIEIVVKPKAVAEIQVKPLMSEMPKPKSNPKKNFKIIELEDNKMLASSTEKITQTYSGMTLISNLKYKDSEDPIANVSVLLVDENGFVLKRSKTDSKGVAKFEMLDPDLNYEVIVDNNDPNIQATAKKDGKTLKIKDPEIIQKAKGYSLISRIEFDESSEPAAEVYVLLIDNQGNILKKGRTDDEGRALFHELEDNKNYSVIIDKNHPSLNVDVKKDGRVIEVDTEKILEKFDRLTVLSRLSYTNSEKPATEIPVMLVDENGLVLKKGMTDENGMAAFIMPDDNQKYTIVIDKESMGLATSKRKKSDGVNNIYFDFNSDKVRDEAEIVLEDLIVLLKDNPDKKIAIHAHTDALGSDEINMAIAKRRGEGVKRLLVSKGIDPSRVSVNAIGDDKPLASNDDAMGRQMNRRVEFEITN